MDTHYSQQEIDAFVRDAIGRVATGPEYSKDLSFDEARRLMQHILEDVTDPVQAGIYLIALRMKRETEDENGGSLQAVLDATDRVTAEVDRVVDIAEPYDGYLRGAPVMAFLPVAGCGWGWKAVLPCWLPVGYLLAVMDWTKWDLNLESHNAKY